MLGSWGKSAIKPTMMTQVHVHAGTSTYTQVHVYVSMLYYDTILDAVQVFM